MTEFKVMVVLVSEGESPNCLFRTVQAGTSGKAEDLVRQSVMSGLIDCNMEDQMFILEVTALITYNEPLGWMHDMVGHPAGITTTSP